MAEVRKFQQLKAEIIDSKAPYPAAGQPKAVPTQEKTGMEAIIQAIEELKSLMAAELGAIREGLDRLGKNNLTNHCHLKCPGEFVSRGIFFFPKFGSGSVNYSWRGMSEDRIQPLNTRSGRIAGEAVIDQSVHISLFDQTITAHQIRDELEFFGFRSEPVINDRPSGFVNAW